MSGGGSDLAERFLKFFTEECATSPLYAALSQIIAASPALLEAAESPDSHVTLFFACVQRVLADHADEPLAAYYASFGGDRAPDDALAKTFEAFVEDHRAELEGLMATRETQTNEPLRAAQLRPAFGWAQACFGRPLGLIEIGASAGLLLHVDRYRYEFVPDDEFVASSDGLLQRMPVRNKLPALAPFISRDLRITSRVGLDLNPLNPADPETRAWLRALVWPEHAERRARLDAALELAADRPVRLRKGDAVQILAAAVESVNAPSVPCVFVSNALAHFSSSGRLRFVELVRELGRTRDLVVILKEAPESGLGLFTQFEPTEQAEYLGAVVYQSGRERIFLLGACGSHGAWLDWKPSQLA